MGAQCCRPTATLQTLARLATLPRTAALRILKTTRNSHKSIRLLRTVCATLSICLLVRSRSSRMEDSPSLVVSPLQRKSRIHSLPGPSCPLQRRRGWLLDHQDPVQEIHGQIQHASSHFQVLKQQQQQQLAGSRGSKNFKSLFRVVVLTKF